MTTLAERFRPILARKAAKAGVDISQLRIEGCTTDRTWGDRCGLVFYGASAEVNERAARCFLAWAQKQPRNSSYESQNSLSWQGPMNFLRFNNGAQGWHTGPAKSKPAPMPLTGCDFVLECVEQREGFAVNTTYYPCAD